MAVADCGSHTSQSVACRSARTFGVGHCSQCVAAAISPGHAHTRPHIQLACRSHAAQRSLFAWPRGPPRAALSRVRSAIARARAAIPCGGSGRRWDEQEREGLEPHGVEVLDWRLGARSKQRREPRRVRCAALGGFARRRNETRRCPCSLCDRRCRSLASLGLAAPTLGGAA